MASFTIPSSSLLKPAHHVFLFTSTNSSCFSSRKMSIPPLSISISCSSKSSQSSPSLDNEDADNKPKRRLSEQSSWETKDSEGDDYLYRLGKEADNMNIAVGARAGVIDPLFTGNFLGKDSDIVFDYRQKVTRSFEYLKAIITLLQFSWRTGNSRSLQNCLSSGPEPRQVELSDDQ